MKHQNTWKKQASQHKDMRQNIWFVGAQMSGVCISVKEKGGVSRWCNNLWSVWQQRGGNYACSSRGCRFLQYGGRSKTKKCSNVKYFQVSKTIRSVALKCWINPYQLHESEYQITPNLKSVSFLFIQAGVLSLMLVSVLLYLLGCNVVAVDLWITHSKSVSGPGR